MNSCARKLEYTGFETSSTTQKAVAPCEIAN